MEETAQNFEKQFFYKQILDFHSPTSNLLNFVKITGPYCTFFKTFLSTVKYVYLNIHYSNIATAEFLVISAETT
jgi:hypothetical protein